MDGVLSRNTPPNVNEQAPLGEQTGGSEFDSPVQPPPVPVEVDMGKGSDDAQEKLDQQTQTATGDEATYGNSDGSSYSTEGAGGSHPIDKLIYDAQHTFAELTSKTSKTLEQATQAYRKRRNRHPPPGFDKWFEFAQDNNAIIVEDFFDQVYHDLEPFWGLSPAVMRKESWDFEMTMHVRNGRANTTSTWFWTVIWYDLIASIEHLLPDMDMALNAMDEPRLVVPWEDIDGYMKEAAKTAGLKNPKEVISEFQKLPKPGQGDKDVPSRKKEWTDVSKLYMIVSS